MSGARTALVVGAASGMGRATALRLARDGWAVAAADRDAARLDGLDEELRGAGAHAALTVTLDLAGGETVVEAAVAEVVAALGPPWLLAVAAGVLEGGLALDAGHDHYARVLAVNFHGVVQANVAAARAMAAAGTGGRIVNWSSNNAAGGTAGFSAYAASKAAMEAFSRSLALELGPDGITVNTIRPGSVRTPMLGALTQREVDEENARIPLGRFGAPEDAAGLVAFLASDDAAWITGADIALDGGTLAARGRAGVGAVRARLEREAERVAEAGGDAGGGGAAGGG
ncbi:SDR family oxidoreductase, partial [Conexibacter stalactiti]